MLERGQTHVRATANVGAVVRRRDDLALVKEVVGTARQEEVRATEWSRHREQRTNVSGPGLEGMCALPSPVHNQSRTHASPRRTYMGAAQGATGGLE